jgi:hypothetical protein
MIYSATKGPRLYKFFIKIDLVKLHLVWYAGKVMKQHRIVEGVQIALYFFIGAAVRGNIDITYYYRSNT